MIVNGKEIGFKISRKSDVVNYKKALKEMEESEKEIKATGESDLLAVLEALGNMFRSFFITATGVDVIGDCDDIAEMQEMYFAFLKEIEKQQKKCFTQPFNASRIR